MPQKIDISGRRFTRLVVQGPAPSRGGSTMWCARCDCGEDLVVRTASLRSGNTRSCGCIVHEGPSRTHGETFAVAEYRAWQLMKGRAKKSNGRLVVDSRWVDSYAQFLADMGRKPSSVHSLDRIDGAKGYSPDNCRWATPTQQAQNLKSNRLLTFRGETRCLTQWAREFGIAPRTVAQRLDYGWTVERALCTSPLHATYVDRPRVHGETTGGRTSPEYRVWKLMRARCHTSTNQDYADYGGRGIGVCARWETFQHFLADMGRRPSPQHWLDRVDTNGDYSPENCRWAEIRVQQRNRWSNRRLSLGSEILTVQEWCERHGRDPRLVRRRLQLGWDLKMALTTEVGCG